MWYDKDSIKEVYLDFNNINSVNDLVEANKEIMTHEDTVAELMKPVYEHEPTVGHQCAIDILENLLGFHQDMMNHFIEEGDTTSSALWAIDMNRIDTAITILKDVKVWKSLR